MKMAFCCKLFQEQLGWHSLGLFQILYCKRITETCQKLCFPLWEVFCETSAHLVLVWQLLYGTVFSRAWCVSLRVCTSNGAELEGSFNDNKTLHESLISRTLQWTHSDVNATKLSVCLLAVFMFSSDRQQLQIVRQGVICQGHMAVTGTPHNAFHVRQQHGLKVSVEDRRFVQLVLFPSDDSFSLIRPLSAGWSSWSPSTGQESHVHTLHLPVRTCAVCLSDSRRAFIQLFYKNNAIMTLKWCNL